MSTRSRPHPWRLDAFTGPCNLFFFLSGQAATVRRASIDVLSNLKRRRWKATSLRPNVLLWAGSQRRSLAGLDWGWG
ncbi:hypothetical protein N658DRAFT_497522 [Parathielavia hyrcaniae]|uniref:Uncharacterized protein n=1 Tax=Parathielavia hyrcaniae TaxID=113614 RepID=A0AAN6Q3J9_9PEZI|nr:hypothetical protein N658DRAFT_497522 [Parathielavia hyrcaniae]